MKRLFFGVICLCSIGLCQSQAQDLSAISKNYIEAYFAMDQATYGPMLADDAIWADPTWSEIDPNNKPAVGKEAFLSHLKRATFGIQDMAFDINEHFVSGKIATFIGVLKYKYPDQGSGKLMTFEITCVSVLEMEGDKVKKHTDYSDFKTWMKQYQAQLKG